MAKELTDLGALVAEVKTLADEKPTTLPGWVSTVGKLLTWLKANRWTLEDLAAIVSLGTSLWSIIGPTLEKPAVSDPQ
jgi:hypothetical protein